MTKIAVVTGANAGLGYEISRGLAARGMTVVMACRNPEKGQAARDRILAGMPNAKLQLRKLDMSDLDSIRDFGCEFSKDLGQLDLLINNAGVLDLPLMRNKAGHELHLATNYLGPFALNGTLLPSLAKSPSPRIVNVCSNAHRSGKLNLDDFNWQQGVYKGMAAYGRSKIALMTYTLELDRRLRKSGSPVMALSAHPGWAVTEMALQRSHTDNPVGKWFVAKMQKILQTAEEAARSAIYAATSEAVKGGEYYGPGGFGEIYGDTAPARINKKARDVETARRLWKLSEEMTGVRYLSA